MVGIFSRFSVSRAGHRRAQSALGETGVLPSSSEVTGSANIATAALDVSHGVEGTVAFKPVERPIEPLDRDQPIQCPLAEPSILNDGRIWKERVSSGIQKNANLPIMQEQVAIGSGPPKPKPRPPSNRLILPSISAPEHNILKLLQECNESRI